MERSQFTFYRSYYEALMDVEEDLRLPLLMAVIRYALDGREPAELSGAARGMFRLIRPTLDSGRRKAAAGKNGAAVTNRMGSGKKEIEKEIEKENEKELEIESEKENDCDSGFAAFWAAYPRKGEKKKALSVWRRLRPDPDAVMAGLEKWKRSRQWQQEEGRFVPGAVKWLRGEYWLYPPEDPPTPCGARGELGEAELEAIRKILED